MKPFKFLDNTAKIQAMKLKNATQRGKVTRLAKQVQQLNHIVRESGMLLEQDTSRYKGNQYNSYEAAVTAIADKYNGTADWGVMQTGNIIDLRAAFIINEGIKIVRKKDKADNEMKWAKEFLKYNDLDREVTQIFAKEAEIEGKIALKLSPEKINKKSDDGTDMETYAISIRYVSWTDKGYKITTDPQDYLRYKTMTWQPPDKDKPEVLNAEKFVYKKFGGRVSDPNDAAPKIMKCLTEIDNLSKALADWREIDRLFAGPILAAECKDREEQKSARQALADKNWKLKKIFVSTAKLYYAQFDINGIDALEKEIITLAKMISGATGIPVHFLGFTDILKQVATARNLMELVKASTTLERETWIGAYEEAITKAMIMYNNLENKNMGESRKLDPTKIGVEIPFITEEQWSHLINLYLPAAIANKISDEAFQEEIPGLDLDAEKKRKDKKDKDELISLKKEAENLRSELTNQDLQQEVEKTA